MAFIHGRCLIAQGAFILLASSYQIASMKTSAEIRLDNLREVIRQAGSLQAVADKLDKSHAQISQLNTQAKHSTTGKPRTIGDDIARLIEERFGLEIGWMDNIHPTGAPSPMATDPKAAHEAPKPNTEAPISINTARTSTGGYWPFSISPERFRASLTELDIARLNGYIDGLLTGRDVDRKSEAAG